MWKRRKIDRQKVTETLLLRTEGTEPSTLRKVVQVSEKA